MGSSIPNSCGSPTNGDGRSTPPTVGTSTGYTERCFPAAVHTAGSSSELANSGPSASKRDEFRIWEALSSEDMVNRYESLSQWGEDRH